MTPNNTTHMHFLSYTCKCLQNKAADRHTILAFGVIALANLRRFDSVTYIHSCSQIYLNNVKNIFKNSLNID